MNYYIKVQTINKAKTDIDVIYSQLGFTNLAWEHNSGKAVARFLSSLTGVMRILWSVKKGDYLYLQYPLKKFYYMACTFAHWKGAKVVTVIHDLGAFRRKKLTPEQENQRLSKTDYLICHNDTMKDYLVRHGFRGYIYSLGIFDYLSNAEPKNYPSPHHPWRVAYAGELNHHRNGYLYQLAAMGHAWDLYLYGRHFEAENVHDPHIFYVGNFKEDDLVRNVEADFGLVWDGGSTKECEGAWGSYLKINNPHKTSFYLRAGIPVIVWKQAAMRDFILKHNLGICINSLDELNDALSALTTDEYQQLRDNAKHFSRLLAEGHFTKSAFENVRSAK